jgi:glycosyltransferase involved in cell wall biosynthesis
MRIGWNPLKRIQRPAPASRVTVVTVTHVPFLAGYYAQSLDVLKLMLASLRANTAEPFDLFVFDNASGPPIREYLLHEYERGHIQYLVLARQNVGILAAHNFVFGAAPGEYVAYADSDLYFHPGWLAASLQILQTFPGAGIVSGVPIHHQSEIATASTLAWASQDPEAHLETGALIPREWTVDQCEGFGRDPDRYLAERQAIANARITYRGARAYAGAFINQFVGRKDVIAQTLPFSEEWLLHGAGDLLTRLDELGHLVLSTDGLYVHHLGNTLNARWRQAANDLGVQPGSAPLPASHNWLSRLGRLSLARRALLRLYDGLFRLLYRGV